MFVPWKKYLWSEPLADKINIRALHVTALNCLINEYIGNLFSSNIYWVTSADLCLPLPVKYNMSMWLTLEHKTKKKKKKKKN